MTIRFDLPDSLEECDDLEEAPEPPCFPYPALEDRPEGIELWSPYMKYPVRRHAMTLNLRGENVKPHGLTSSRFGQHRVLLSFRRTISK